MADIKILGPDCEDEQGESAYGVPIRASARSIAPPRTRGSGTTS